MSVLQDHLQNVRDRMKSACLRCGRDPEEVTLIAVSKTKPAEMVQEVYDLGVRDFGENRPQEIRDKAPVLPDDIRWHMIGQLQKNKIKYVVGHACCIHSIDSFELAEAVSIAAEKLNLVMPVLIEVNVAGEVTKSGVKPEDTEELIRRISVLKGIRTEGLMTIAPYTETPEDNRPYFRSLRKLFVDIAAKNIDNVTMRSLSMGMTGDYEIAVEEGATMIRVGTGIFGERDYYK